MRMKINQTETPEQMKERKIFEIKKQIAEIEKRNTYFDGDSESLRKARESQKEISLLSLKRELEIWVNK